MSRLPTYAALPHWRAVHAALPKRLQIPEPWTVREEWLRTEGCDIHLDRWSAERPRASVVLVHGAGGNGRMLALYGEMCRKLGYDAVAPDMPGYGLTRVGSKRGIVYEDWRKALSEVVEAEAARGLPVFIFGLSMGGMLAYEAAARTRAAAGVVVTCLMEPRNPQVRRQMGRWPWMGELFEPMLSGATWLTDGMPMFMKLAGNMASISNSPSLTRAIIADPRAGGNWMPGRFLRTFLTAPTEVEPENFDVCPVLMAHPADDKWTDVSISKPFLDRITRMPTEFVLLQNGGHFPVEEPAHEQLVEAFRRFVERCIATRFAVAAE